MDKTTLETSFKTIMAKKTKQTELMENLQTRHAKLTTDNNGVVTRFVDQNKQVTLLENKLISQTYELNTVKQNMMELSNRMKTQYDQLQNKYTSLSKQYKELVDYSKEVEKKYDDLKVVHSTLKNTVKMKQLENTIKDTQPSVIVTTRNLTQQVMQVVDASVPLTHIAESSFT